MLEQQSSGVESISPSCACWPLSSFCWSLSLRSQTLASTAERVGTVAVTGMATPWCTDRYTMAGMAGTVGTVVTAATEVIERRVTGRGGADRS
ncbi:uncharacterized protein LOC124362064 isoform X2 [Homalodisca vitripennis]|uniref:uncharacterized protein LOC124362064 isoform X2 n=1 Tax=Homalodisca vitripennis TaxID=197043 RepID=UPI001EEB1A36|nr:uncharacterized protein LOC124362064 isoform X2 [Homalodisca vitripennis]